MRENQANALNYFGYWRLLDALCEAGFSGKTIEAAVGPGNELPMGQWSDGVPVKPMLVKTSP